MNTKNRGQVSLPPMTSGLEMEWAGPILKEVDR